MESFYQIILNTSDTVLCSFGIQLFKKKREIERFIWTINTFLSCGDQIKPASF